MNFVNTVKAEGRLEFDNMDAVKRITAKALDDGTWVVTLVYGDGFHDTETFSFLSQKDAEIFIFNQLGVIS